MTIAATLIGRNRASATRLEIAANADRLSPVQVASLGILLVAAQLPQAVYLPLWVGVLGIGLVLLRFALLRRERTRPLTIPPWALALIAVAIAFLIRRQFGYFVGRDPCVAFLFVLLGIKFLEVRTLRDGTLLVCLAIFLLITPFFYNQSLLAGFAALPAVLATGGAPSKSTRNATASDSDSSLIDPGDIRSDKPVAAA